LRAGRNLKLRAIAAAAVVAMGLSLGRSGLAEGLRGERKDYVGTLTPLTVGSSYHLFAGAGFGGSLRFNNPYRLRQQLGDSAESISVPPPYFNARIGGTIRGAGKLSHGAEFDASFGLGGVPQEVVTPSYVALYHWSSRWAVRGRAGIPLVIEPDFNAGFEIAAGGVFFTTAALGVTLDLVGSLFFGAATVETPRTAIPLLSLELGILYDYEVLP
jgi:hypothetical protein